MSSTPRQYVWVIIAAILLSVGDSAQAQDGAPQPNTPYVLNVYANRIQIPTLVLQHHSSVVLQPDTTLHREQFNISLDAGPVFHPTAMHIQGNEPLTLAILVELSGSQPDIESSANKALPQLATALQSHDHFSLYVTDCNSIRTADDLPATSDTIRQGLLTGETAPELHGKKHKPSCSSSLRLWDTAFAAIDDLSKLPGRHAILMLSSGNDSKSQSRLGDLISFANAHNVSIFGVREASMASASSPFQQQEDRFWELCMRTGGYLYTIKPNLLDGTLQNIITDLRSLYILEFPRPDNYTAGPHIIQVTIPSTPGDIPLPGGAYVPLDDASQDDPHTVKNAPTPDQLGQRRPLQPR